MSHPRCVGWGEMGLDYHYNNSPPEVQREVLTRQLRCAVGLGKSLTIHTREADEDIERILKAEVPQDHKVRFMSFKHAAIIQRIVRFISTASRIPPNSLSDYSNTSLTCASVSRVRKILYYSVRSTKFLSERCYHIHHKCKHFSGHPRDDRSIIGIIRRGFNRSFTDRLGDRCTIYGSQQHLPFAHITKIE